jgi:osmotically-inducible protein OsmY
MRLNRSFIALALKQFIASNPTDSDLARRVATFLATQHRPGLRLLEVEARAGVVTLRGQVSTFYEKQLSAQLTRRVAGVLRLVDEVIVQLSLAENGRMPAGRTSHLTHKD